MIADTVREEFSAATARVWLNAAHQGPLPRRARAQTEKALDEKSSPWRLEDSEFWDIPAKLKPAVAQLIGVPADEVILGNSTTYGLNLLAHGLPLNPGDQVLVVDGDFPATVVTWLPLRERGIDVDLVKPSGPVITADDVARAITPATKVLACSWVFSFTGYAADIAAIGRVCKEREVVFVVNGSQAIGARPIDVSSLPVDALVGCGFKWLCGPYATGYAWIRPSIVESLRNRPAYWLSQLDESGLGAEVRYELRDDLGAAAFDVFCTANFLNFTAWEQSLSLLNELGIEDVAAYDAALVDRVIAGAKDAGFDVLSPEEGSARSTLVFISHPDPSRNDAVHAALKNDGVHVANRVGALRVSPHFYNDTDDVDRFLAALRKAR